MRPRPFLRPWPNTRGCANIVHILPPRKDVEFYYAAADAYVGPSLEDTFALPAAEAMACGLPVIISARAGASDIVHDGVDALVLNDPKDAAALATMIRRLYTDEPFRETSRRGSGENGAPVHVGAQWPRTYGDFRRGLAAKAKVAFGRANVDPRTVTEKLKGKRKVLVLAPSLKSIGGVQNYIRTLVDALNVVLGSDRVRVVAVAGDPEVRGDGSLALSRSVKLRFLGSAVATALSWSPDLIVCAHVGLAPAARLIQKITRIPYWLILYGIEVWGDLPPAKVRALREAQRYVTITRFTLDAMIARHNLKEPRASILPPTLPKARPPSSEAEHVSSTKRFITPDSAYRWPDRSV